MRYLRYLGFVEATSLLFLLGIGIPLKYGLGYPAPNRILGTLHGLLFVMYTFTCVSVGREHGWSLKKILGSIAVASLPFGPFLFDKTFFYEHDH